MVVKNLTAQEFFRLKNKGEQFELIDVRTKEEYAITNIGGKLIPLDELKQRHMEITQGAKLILLCHHGKRSLIACLILEKLGYKDLSNLSGGIDAYSLEVDSNILRY
jgi:sulfur-carrier protein adenylyltransferase/sulfurtransferase